MRKRNLTCVFDNIFWYTLYALPVIFYLFAFISRNYTPVAFDVFFDFIGVDVHTTLVYGTLLDLFGTSGVFPLFDNPTVFTVLTWFVNVFIIHLCIDFLLFIPRLAHKWMSKFSSSD